MPTAIGLVGIGRGIGPIVTESVAPKSTASVG